MERIVKTFCGICERTCGMKVTVKENKVHKKIPPGKFFKDGFYTYSGKIEIYSHSLESNGYNPGA